MGARDGGLSQVAGGRRSCSQPSRTSRLARCESLPRRLCMRVRRWAIGSLSAAGAVVLAGAAAWACVSGPAVNLSTVNAKPGDTITVSGTNFSKTDPVTVRWNSLDGPIVGNFAAPVGGNINGTVTVPADAKAGNYV